MNFSTPDWVAELQESLSHEFGDSARLATLATVGTSGQPRARTIVMRTIEEDGTIWFCTDARSEKVRQIAENSSVELVIWLPSARLQYRIEARASRVVERESLASLWTKLKDAAKITFTWPMPGERRDDAAIAQASLPTEMPETFAAYRLFPSQIEFLSVAESSHPRWIARQSEGWLRREVNP